MRRPSGAWIAIGSSICFGDGSVTIPKPDKLWTAELKRRFGAAAPDVLDAYRIASGVASRDRRRLSAGPQRTRVARVEPRRPARRLPRRLAHDGRFIAGVSEAVHNRLQGVASAMQTPSDTAELLRDRAAKIEAALARVQAKLPAGQPEWRDSQPDFQALSLLASYHAHKMLALDQAAYFDQTGDPAALEAARREIAAAIPVWETLASLDIGPWRDKLLYVRHDLKLIEEREKIFQQFGRFDFGFDFGGPAQGRQLSYRSDVEPRFQAVDPGTRFTEGAASAGSAKASARRMRLHSRPTWKCAGWRPIRAPCPPTLSTATGSAAAARRASASAPPTASIPSSFCKPTDRPLRRSCARAAASWTSCFPSPNSP